MPKQATVWHPSASGWTENDESGSRPASDGQSLKLGPCVPRRRSQVLFAFSSAGRMRAEPRLLGHFSGGRVNALQKIGMKIDGCPIHE
jgi:hypothetical protein